MDVPYSPGKNLPGKNHGEFAIWTLNRKVDTAEVAQDDSGVWLLFGAENVTDWDTGEPISASDIPSEGHEYIAVLNQQYTVMRNLNGATVANGTYIGSTRSWNRQTGFSRIVELISYTQCQGHEVILTSRIKDGIIAMTIELFDAPESGERPILLDGSLPEGLPPMALAA